MDQIAVISDIHGNLTALQTVLEDIRERGITRIFCLGDIVAKGTHSEECVKIIKETCEVAVQGNCDDVFSSEIDLTGKSELTVQRIRWNQNKLSDGSKEYLRNLPFAHEFYLSGRLVRIFHSSPERNDAYIGGFHPIDRLFGMFLPSEKTPSDQIADIVIYGHIHLPYMQKLYNRVLLNAGSAGNAMDCVRDPARDGDFRNTALINYLILRGEMDSHDWEKELSYEWISLPYDYEKELSENDDNIEKEDYEKELRFGWYRDMAKVYRFAKELNK
ncbi:MAG: metallophosphoesterase family protein [Firmicutes bacterium]|nr:metallophosphoesterase family protein [Bacillota bacterium]